MRTLTDLQAALLAARHGEGKVTAKFGSYRFVTGEDPIVVASELYRPRGLDLGEIQIASSNRIQTTLTVADDADNTIALDVLDPPSFEGTEVLLISYELDDETGWVETLRIAWSCVGIRIPRTGAIVIDLAGTAGLNPRAWLELASRDRWRFAPEPGEIVRWTGSSIIWGPGETTEPPDTTGGGGGGGHGGTAQPPPIPPATD